jgi:predicted enzyme related to lactoylglutathione lyase
VEPRVTTIIFPTADLVASTRMFRALLGEEPMVNQPYYVGWRIDGRDIGLDPSGQGGATGAVCYWEVEDIEQAREQLLAAGAVERSPIRDVGGGKLVTLLDDPSGNVVGLSTSRR